MEGAKEESKRALITGITGQDGSYLAEFLLSKGYEVHGIMRRASTFNTGRIDHIFHDIHEKGVKLKLHYGDMCDGTVLRRIVEVYNFECFSCCCLPVSFGSLHNLGCKSVTIPLQSVSPHEVYNLAAQSHVKVSFLEPEYTADAVAMGTLRLLDVMRDFSEKCLHEIRMYQAGSSEMFGATEPPQSEATPFYPRSPYAVSKVAAHWFVVNYREAYGLFLCNGILFNHESPRRGETFVTRKITRAVGRIKMGLQKKLYLGNLAAKRDWGFAKDFVEAMWLMLQQDEPDDFVICTGESHSVQEFLELAFSSVDLNWKDFVEIDPKYFRPTEVDFLQGDASKAKEKIGWEVKTSFKELVKIMVEHDVEMARKEKVLADHKEIE